MKKLILTAILLFFSLLSFSQFGIGTESPDNSAQLDISSTTKGFLPPRMTTAQRDVIDTPAIGLIIFNTTTSSLQINTSSGWTNLVSLYPTTAGDMMYWNGTTWVRVAAGVNGQTLTYSNGVPVWTDTVVLSNIIVSPTGKIWMDRNLGATQVATSFSDVNSYGYYYQWGRGNDGHQLRTSTTTTTLSATDLPGNANFITAPNSPNDWRVGQNNNLWQGSNGGINNPCPAGFRVPTIAEFQAERSRFSPDGSTGAYNSVLKLPAAGYRSGDIVGEATYGRYWSSTISGTNAFYLFIHTSFTNTTNSWYRTEGYSVRCIKY
jgi:hypothetical protein